MSVISADVELLGTGDRRAGDRVLAALRSATKDERGEYLDAVARLAAGGSTAAMDVLLTAVDELGLIPPAVRRLVLDSSMVDDVAQDVLIAVSEKISSFRSEAKFTTWLYTVARFKAIDRLRRERRRAEVGYDDSDELPDGERISSMVANRTSLRAAIDTLPAAYRQAVLARDIERLTYDEIADQVDIPVNTAKSRVFRGRALLAGMIAEPT